VTAIAGMPPILVTALVLPATHGLELRSGDDEVLPWLPINLSLMWAFAIITCTVISWVIYSLRAEVRQARRLGQYVLGEKLGEGGMGEVYRARHGMMRRDSAIKLLPADNAGETNIRRFEREVQLTARQTHPNTITIFDYGRTAKNVFYYAMELLQGATLQRIVEISGPQPEGRVVRMLAMACGALAEAHGVGLIHRDIKPANIMLCTQGGEQDVVKVLDFGLVKAMDVHDEVQLTGLNTITGTPQYIAPEAITDANSVDARTDLYALGAVGYYLLTGEHVFEGNSIVEICSHHLHSSPSPMSERGVAVSPELEHVVLSCLAKDPAQRPESAQQLRGKLLALKVESWAEEHASRWWTEHATLLEAPRKPDAAFDRTITRIG